MPQDQLVPDAVSRWRAAAEAGDAAAARGSLAPDVVLVSPLTEQFRFTGRDQVTEVLSAAFAVLDGIRFHTEVRDGGTVALFARAWIGRQDLEEAQLLRLDAEARIRELTLFLRPLPAVTGLMSRLGPALARNEGRRGLANFLAAATGPLHAMARLGERRIVPLADPGRNTA
jgi:hypothetical protein